MKTFLIFIFSCLGVFSYSQDYFNRIIPFEFGNPLPLQITQFENNFYIPIWNPDSVCTIIVSDLYHEEYFHYANFEFSSFPLNILDNSIYAYATDRNQNKGLKLAKLNSDMTFNWVASINTIGDYNSPVTSIGLNNSLYNVFFYEEEDLKKIGYNRTNSGGELIWTKYPESNTGYSYPYDLHASFDEHILATYKIRLHNENRSRSYLMKFDSLGTRIWQTAPLEKVYAGSPHIKIAELSNTDILLTYRKDMNKDPDFVWNYNRYPPAFKWLDKNGECIKEDIFKLPKTIDIKVSEIKKGNGEYYFIVGGYFERNDSTYNYHGFITKCLNDGKFIWTHKFRHENFDSKEINYTIRDLVELENGDIVALGIISVYGESRKIWLFKVNEYGCFGEEDCEELQIVNTGDIIKDRPNFTLYPNPANSYLHIKTDADFQRITIFDVYGNLVSVLPFSSEVNIEGLRKGVYILHLNNENGQHISSTFIKQ